MGLSCTFSDDCAEWYYLTPEDFTTLQTNRRKRCCSCKKLINIGDICVKFERFRDPNSDIEERIYGDTVPLADWYMCEECGGLFFNFIELGFYVTLGDDMRELIEEYLDLKASKERIK